MNHAYRLVYNDRTGHHVPAPETSRTRGKSSGGKAMRTTARATLAGAAAACCTVIAGPAQAQAPAADALPTGGQVVAGQAIISQPEAARMLIDQGSDRAIIDWQQFDIGSAAAVHFQQPSADSAALNRVIAGDASQIHGQLSANGQVWLVNPNGVLFGEGSRVDVGGLVTSTLNITNQDFLDGKAVFERDGATGSIINQGTITAADGGLVALLAPTVVNDGIISARMGHVVLAAGEQVTLDAGANGLLQVAVDPATVQTLVENRQLIVADGGQAIMTGKAADALAGGVVANTGTVQARTLAEHNGRILLLGDMDHGTVAHSGVLDASAPDGGDGGFIDTSAATVRISQTAQVTTHAPQGQTGTWLIDPSDFTIAASGGDITGAQLSTNLAGTSIEIQSSGGDNDGQGDIHVNDAVNWNTNTLTLTAARDININAVMTAGGDSKLVMNTGTANGGDDAVTDGRVRVGLAPGAPNGFAGRVDFPDRSGTGFLTINGAAYHVLGANDLGTEGDASNTTLQGIRNNLGGKYALGAHIDASATATWNSDGSGGHYGFTPIGENFPSFTGHFDGLGHVVEGLYINRTGVNFVGMFGTTRAGAIIRNVGVTNADVAAQSYVGALLGQIITSGHSGQFHNIHSNGTVRGSGSAVAGLIGGGSVYDPLYIGHAYSSATVSGWYYAAGVVGELSVFAPTVIEHAGASGTVSSNNAGGLLGRITNYGSTLDLRNLYSTATVITGHSQSGSLAGHIEGTATLRNSFASGSAPNLFGRAQTHGDGTVTFSGVFWDTDQAPGFAGYNGGVSTAGAVGLTTAQMRTLANYNSATEANGNVNPAWDISGDAGDDTIWRIYNGDSYPVLRAWQTAPIVTAHDDTTVYNGNAYSGGTGYTAGAPVTGTPTWGGDSQGAKNAGNYTITLSGLSPDRSTQRDYQYWNENIVYRDGALTITPAALAIAAKSDLTKVYGNTYAISADDLDVTGLQSSDRIDNIDFDSAGAAATAGVNGGTPYDLTVSNATGDNFNADNYTITYHDGKLTITPRDLTIAAKSNLTKTYGDIYTFSDSDLDITGLQNGDQIDSVDFASTGAAATAGVNGGTPYDVTVSNATGDDFNAGNYSITYHDGKLTITPAALAVTAKSDLTKTYGDTYTFSDSDLLSVTGLKNSDAVDSVVFASTGAAATAGVNGGTPYDVTVSNATGDDFNAGNYSITYHDGKLTITPATLTVTAKSNLTKVYGDTYAISVDDLNVTGLKNSDKINNIDFDSAGAAATASVNGGTPYAVTVENATGDSFDAGNYTITYNNGALTISPKALTVTAKSDLTKVYGETYAFSANDLDITGLQNGETIGNADFASAGATATASVNGGTPYDVTVDNATGGTFNANNYTITYHDGALTITPAALTVTALDAEKTHDDVAWSGGNGIRLDGLVNNETQDVLSGTLAYGGNSQGAVDAGRYQITPSGLSSDNYVISFLDGVLTIRPSASPQEVPETNPTMPSGGSLSTSSGLEDQGTTESTPGPRVVTGQNGTSDQGGIPYLAIEGDVVALGTSTSGEETE